MMIENKDSFISWKCNFRIDHEAIGRFSWFKNVVFWKTLSIYGSKAFFKLGISRLQHCIWYLKKKIFLAFHYIVLGNFCLASSQISKFENRGLRFWITQFMTSKIRNFKPRCAKFEFGILWSLPATFRVSSRFLKKPWKSLISRHLLKKWHFAEIFQKLFEKPHPMVCDCQLWSYYKWSGGSKIPLIFWKLHLRLQKTIS